MPETEPLGDSRTVEIFISYSARTKDEKELSSHLIDLLTSAFALEPQALFAYTVPGRGAKSGARLMDELKEALAESKVVLAIVTPAAADSSYGQFEVAASDLGGKYRVPLLPDPSFHSHVPVLFREIAARSLASIGEICQLLEDLRGPLGRPVEPACMWITNAERVVAAAHAVAGHLLPEARVAQLAADLERSKSGSAALRKAAIAAGILAFTAAVGLAALWSTQLAMQRSLAATEAEAATVAGDLTTCRQAVADANRRSLLLPALKIEGTVTTAAGTPAEHAVVAACAALPTIGGAGSRPGEVCPEDLRLNWETDSDGVFRLDLRSLPLPAAATDALGRLGASPLEEIWLIAQHDAGDRAVLVRTVLDRKLTLRD